MRHPCTRQHTHDTLSPHAWEAGAQREAETRMGGGVRVAVDEEISIFIDGQWVLATVCGHGVAHGCMSCVMLVGVCAQSISQRRSGCMRLCSAAKKACRRWHGWLDVCVCVVCTSSLAWRALVVHIP